MESSPSKGVPSDRTGRGESDPFQGNKRCGSFSGERENIVNDTKHQCMKTYTEKLV